MDRPKIEQTLDGFTLEQAHTEYMKSTLLFKHIQFLDEYIDYLEEKFLVERERKFFCGNWFAGKRCEAQCDECKHFEQEA